MAERVALTEGGGLRVPHEKRRGLCKPKEKNSHCIYGEAAGEKLVKKNKNKL